MTAHFVVFDNKTSLEFYKVIEDHEFEKFEQCHSFPFSASIVFVGSLSKRAFNIAKTISW